MNDDQMCRQAEGKADIGPLLLEGAQGGVFSLGYFSPQRPVALLTPSINWKEYSAWSLVIFQGQRIIAELGEEFSKPETPGAIPLSGDAFEEWWARADVYDGGAAQKAWRLLLTTRGPMDTALLALTVTR